MSGLGATLDRFVALASRMQRELDDPEHWPSPPRLTVVIDDPGGKRIIPHGYTVPMELIVREVTHG